jgi:hypothetical protein
MAVEIKSAGNQAFERIHKDREEVTIWDYITIQ